MIVFIIIVVFIIIIISQICSGSKKSRRRTEEPKKFAMDEYPEIGDRIEIYRSLYQHWAVYVGDGDVVHLTSASSCCSSSGRKSKSTVKREKLEDVVGQDKYRFNNLLDDHYKPRRIKEILKDAQSLVGEIHPYNVIKNNCEHFATKLRYGISLSQQAETVEAVVGAVVPQPVRSVWEVVTGRFR